MDKIIKDVEHSVSSFPEDSKICTMYSGLEFPDFISQYIQIMQIKDIKAAKDTLIMGTIEYAMRSTFPELFEIEESLAEEEQKKEKPEKVD